MEGDEIPDEPNEDLLKKFEGAAGGMKVRRAHNESLLVISPFVSCPIIKNNGQEISLLNSRSNPLIKTLYRCHDCASELYNILINGLTSYVILYLS